MGKGAGHRNDRYVVRYGSEWAVRAPGAAKVSSVHGRQDQAEVQAKKTVAGLGGGEVRVQSRNGQWRDSDTVKPGNDPFPPRDKNH
jgi:hypothetical protein